MKEKLIRWKWLCISVSAIGFILCLISYFALWFLMIPGFTMLVSGFMLGKYFNNKITNQKKGDTENE